MNYRSSQTRKDKRMNGISLIMDAIIHKKCQVEGMIANASPQDPVNPEFLQEIGLRELEIHNMCPYIRHHNTESRRCWTCGWESVAVT